MRAQAQPLRLRMSFRQLAAQANACRWRQAGGDLNVNADADRALVVEQPLFTAAQQRLPIGFEQVFTHHTHAIA
ncbi:hypothetical protein D3C79_1055840 [compost metagenome]